MEKETVELLSKLSDTEFRVFMTLEMLLNRWGEVEVDMEELGTLTGLSRSTLSRAVKNLTSKSWIEVVRTKRNFGMLHNNKYKILRCVTSETSKPKTGPLRCVTGDTPTDLYKSLITINKANTNKTIKVINTTYLLEGDALKEEKMVNRWSDDDDLPVMGSLEEDTPKASSISKRDPKTRNLRPQDEWTAADVASEFAKRIYAKFPGIPGIVNTTTLRMILSKNRKAHGLNATIEMEAMERFFGDERTMLRVRNSPSASHLMFVKSITNNITNILDDLDMTSEPLDSEPNVSYVYATDGKKFDNSMFGRKALDRYEESLKRA
jgi:hypothetical protein